MTAELVHIGAALAFGGFTGSYWAGLRTQKAWWLVPSLVFLVLAAFAAGYR